MGGRGRGPGVESIRHNIDGARHDRDRARSEPTLGVVLLAPTRLSETFIAHEIQALMRRRLPIRVYALRPDGKVGEGIVTPPAGIAARALALGAAHIELFIRKPRRYVRLLWRKVVRRTWVRVVTAKRLGKPVSLSHVREFLLAGWLATKARQARLMHLHAHYASEPATVATLVHELMGTPVSFTAHAKDVYTASRHRLRKKIQSASFVTTCSSSVRDYLIQAAPERADVIHLVHHGISPEVLAALDLDPDLTNGRNQGETFSTAGRHSDRAPPRILSAGRLVEKKGFEDLVRALALLRERGVVFQAEIVGDGRLLPALKTLAQTHGLDGIVHFPGALEHAVLARRYPGAACFVMPSRQLQNGNQDGIPNVLLEAMAAGVPVVATRVGGIPEVVTDGVTGTLVGEGRISELATAISAVLAAPVEAAERASQARCAVRARFDLERSADRLVELWRNAGALPNTRPRELRVGYVLKRYPRLSETFILNEILEQERQGALVHIISLKKPDEGRFHSNLARVRAGVTYLPGYILPSLGLIARSNWKWLRRRPRAYLGALGIALQGGDRHRLTAFWKSCVLADVAVERHCDVLHAHFATGATFSAMLASRLSGIPFGFTAHARDLFGEHIQRSALRRKVDLASYVVVVSRASQRSLQAMVGDELARKAICIHNGVEPRLLTRHVAPHGGRGTPMILGVGRLVEKKGFAHLLTAASTLQRRGFAFRLAIVGDGPLRRELEELAANLGLEVRFLGALTHDKVMRAMAGAYAVVLPAVIAADGDRDVLPTVLLEAQALEKPVVATHLTGIPEIVEDGVTGILVQESELTDLPTALTGALERLLRDRELAAGLGIAGRKRMTARFAMSNSVAALAECMRAAAEGDGVATLPMSLPEETTHAETPHAIPLVEVEAR
jgi:colanic acid/amylovoran biosynthesis glycosyltransferase